MDYPEPARRTIPVLGIVAWSGTGKTTLLEALLPRLTARGWPAAVIKHAHHAFDIDTPGKDSHRLRMAGASPTLVASSQRFALMMETPGQAEPQLGPMIAHVATLHPALILVEGFKSWPIAKLELRRDMGRGEKPEPDMAESDPWIRAVAAKRDATHLAPGWLNLDDPDAIAEWIARWANEFDPERDIDESLAGFAISPQVPAEPVAKLPAN